VLDAVPDPPLGARPNRVIPCQSKPDHRLSQDVPITVGTNAGALRFRRAVGGVFVLEWLFGAVVGYALMLLLLGLYVVRARPTHRVARPGFKKRARPSVIENGWRAASPVRLLLPHVLPLLLYGSFWESLGHC
jgi:hypothetical protein